MFNLACMCVCVARKGAGSEVKIYIERSRRGGAELILLLRTGVLHNHFPFEVILSSPLRIIVGKSINNFGTLLSSYIKKLYM